ncbi:MAG: hypothetical protein FJ279_27690, partial [Planctomycetes bacterium]|nr:hypothetical protein [Planctomycetota bacterium]
MPQPLIRPLVLFCCLFLPAALVWGQAKEKAADDSLPRALETLRADVTELHAALEKVAAAYGRWAAAHDEDEAAEEALDEAHADRDLAQAAVALDEEAVEFERALRDPDERAEVLKEITARFGFKPKDIEALQRQGHSLTQIIIAANLAMAAEKSVEEVLKLKDERHGWAAVARELDVDTETVAHGLNL